MMKKRILLLCTLFMLGTVSLAACGGTGNNGSEAPYQDETENKVNNGGNGTNNGNGMNNGNGTNNGSGTNNGGAGSDLEDAGRNLMDSIKDTGDAIRDGVDNLGNGNR